MKQTIIMLLAAVLLGSANVFSQSYIDGYKGDVNGDGTVDVADIASVIQIMANGGWINTKPTYPVKADFTGLKIESGSSTQYIEYGRTATWEVSLAPGYVDWFSTITNARVIGDGDIRRIISNPVDTAGFDVSATASTEKKLYYVYFGRTAPDSIETTTRNIPIPDSGMTSGIPTISSIGWYLLNNEQRFDILFQDFSEESRLYVLVPSSAGFVPYDLYGSVDESHSTWNGGTPSSISGYTLWATRDDFKTTLTTQFKK